MLRTLLVALLLVTGCRPRRDLSQYTVEDPKSALLARLEMGNAAHAKQFKGGFHQIEEGGWRWTERKFAVELRQPFAGAKLGATLTLRGSLPEVVLAKTGPVKLQARVGDLKLAELPLSAAGEFVYTAAVPRSALSADSVVVEFETDKALPPGAMANDGRELALIVTQISLETTK
jgi:hypothetical protein